MFLNRHSSTSYLNTDSDSRLSWFQAYLSDEDFSSIMGMTKDAFYKLPKWKQDMNKKKVDLF